MVRRDDGVEVVVNQQTEGKVRDDKFSCLRGASGLIEIHGK